MASDLIAVAEKAHDIAAALDKFLDPVHDQSAEITALMAECLATSSALRGLDKKIGDFPHHRRYLDIQRDLTTVKDSLDYTLQDVEKIFGRLARFTYGYVWEDLCDFFRRESGNTLCRRLNIYCTVLKELTCILTESLPRDPEYFDELLIKLEQLLTAQEDKFAAALNGIDLQGRVVTRPTSFERRRPVPPPRPESYPDLRGGGRDNDPYQDLDDEHIRGPRRPPPAPDIPGSPTTSHTFSTQSSSVNSFYSSHWLPEAFNQSRPSTLLEDTGQTSVFLAPPMPGAISRIGEDYVKLLEQPFENGDLIVRLYQRAHDGRSRFLCRTIRPARSRKDVTLPLISLLVSRTGPFLKFFDVGDGGKIWACLKFPSYELMALFFCAFLALRFEDTKKPVKEIADYDMHKEKQLFAGYIVDDHYQHGLRLFQERDTGVVRLQASVQNGDLKRKPIWTAFITHQILSPTWMSRDKPRVVHLADLQRYVFTESYNPQKTSTGAHELTFIGSNDAKDFVKVIRELVKSEKDHRR